MTLTVKVKRLLLPLISRLRDVPASCWPNRATWRDVGGRTMRTFFLSTFLNHDEPRIWECSEGRLTCSTGVQGGKDRKTDFISPCWSSLSAILLANCWEKVWKEGEFGSSFQLDEYIVQLWKDIARFESKLKIEAWYLNTFEEESDEFFSKFYNRSSQE